MNISKIILIFAFIFLTACAPGLGTRIDLNAISKVNPVAPEVFKSEDNIKLNVLNFTDNRTNDAMAEIDGRLVRADGDVGLAAQKIFEATAKKAGVTLSLFNAPIIRGAIKDWYVHVVPSFPASKLEANATVGIDLLDRDSNVILTSVYSGSYEEQNPFLGDSGVQSALGKAMAFAVGEVFKDDVFISKLNVTANRGHSVDY